jgi:tetratricopeptide (TPR) repeat protein
MKIGFLTHIFTIFSVACSTTSSQEVGKFEQADSTLTDTPTVTYTGPMVVKQIGEPGITYSRQKPEYWFGLKGSSNALKQIAGLLAQGQGHQAVQASRAYLVKNPNDVQGILLLATALAMERKYSLAAYYAQTGLRLRPGDSMLLNIMGLATYLDQSRTPSEMQQAINLLKRSFESDSKQIASGLNLGGIYLEIGKTAEAQVYYQAVAKRCSDCSSSLVGSGTAHLRSKNYQEAKVAFEKIIAKEPSHGVALYNLAIVYKNGFKNHKQAEKYLFTLLNRTGKADLALRSRAQAFLRTMKGEMNQSERALVNEKNQNKTQGPKSADDKMDAELLMTSGEGMSP